MHRPTRRSSSALRASLTSAGLAIVGAALVAAGCGKAAKKAPPPGKPTTVETICGETDGAAVRVTGHFRYRRAMTGSFCYSTDGHKGCDMTLYATGGTPPSNTIDDVLAKEPPKEIPLVWVHVPVGGSPGEMKNLPARFAEKDVALHLAGGGVAHEGDPVTLDGQVHVREEPADPAVPGSKPGRHCWLVVTWAQAPY